MNPEDALSVHTGVFGVNSDFMLNTSRKQAGLREQGEVTMPNLHRNFRGVSPKQLWNFLCVSVGQYEHNLACFQEPSLFCWVILAPGIFISLWITCFIFLLLGSFLLNRQLCIELITRAHCCRWISFALPLCLPSTPETSVSNLENTMSPHSSMLNTYPSNLQADPITRICHGTHSLLLLDWSGGDRGC